MSAARRARDRANSAIGRLEQTYRNPHAIIRWEISHTSYEEEVRLTIHHEDLRLILEALGRPQKMRAQVRLRAIMQSCNERCARLDALAERRSALEQRGVLLRGASAKLDHVGDILDGVRERLAAANERAVARGSNAHPHPPAAVERLD